MKNTIEMTDITKMPYFTNGEIDFWKIAPAPEALVNIGNEMDKDVTASLIISDEMKKEAVMASLTEALTIPVKSFNKEKMEMLRNITTRCFIHDFAWSVTYKYIKLFPKDKTIIPDEILTYIENTPDLLTMRPLDMKAAENWIRRATPEELDEHCIMWGEDMEMVLHMLFKDEVKHSSKKWDLTKLKQAGDTYIANYKKYGAMTLREWINEHWGTESNAFNTDIESENKIKFYNHGNIPMPILQKISADNPGKTLFGKFFEEDDLTLGEYTIEHGEVTYYKSWPLFTITEPTGSNE